MLKIFLQNAEKGVGKPPGSRIFTVRAQTYETCKWPGGAGTAPGPAQEEVLLSKGSLLQELADRAAVELARVAAARPALGSRCERAVGILANHAAAPRSGVIRAQLRGGELVGYLVRGSGGAVYRVESKGSWRCSCPDHHGRHRRRDSSRACKHALAVWALWQAAVGAPARTVAAVEASRRRERAAA